MATHYYKPPRPRRDLSLLSNRAAAYFKDSTPDSAQLAEWLRAFNGFDFETAKEIAASLILLWKLYEAINRSKDRPKPQRCTRLLPGTAKRCDRAYVHSESNSGEDGSEYITLICSAKHRTKLRVK